MTEFAWGDPELSDTSLPWRKLSSGRLNFRTLWFRNPSTDNKWHSTKLMTIVGATRLAGKLIYIKRYEKIPETEFHVTTFDALLRAAQNTDDSIKARSVELSGDAETLREYCELLGVDWYVVKEDVQKRMAIAAVLGDMSERYLPAIRLRLQYVSEKAGRTANLKDQNQPQRRDNPSAMRAQWHAAAKRLDAQYEFNEKAAGSAADMVLLARSVQAHVDDLIGNLFSVDGTGKPGAAGVPMRALENFVIFNSPNNATAFMQQFRRGKRVDPDLVSVISAAFVAEQQMCAASGLASLVRDSEEFRTQQVFEELRDKFTWPSFDPGYDSLSMQLLAFVDVWQVATSRSDFKGHGKVAKSIKALIRNPRQPSTVAA